jgi:protease-4
VSTAAQEVFAEASTITGSIGVFAVVPTFNRALKALGIGTDGVKSTPYSGDPDAIRGLTPDTKLILQASVEDIYRRFTGLVARARALPVTRVDEIGQGRVWAGNTARDLKLVDHLGGLDMAVAAAAKRAGLPAGVRTIDVEKSQYLPFQLLSSLFSDDDGDDATDADASIRDPFARGTRLSQLRLFSAIGEAQAIASGPTIQVHCLACSTLTPPRSENVARAESWIAKALALAAQASR